MSQRSIVAHDADDCAETTAAALSNRCRPDTVCRHTSLHSIRDCQARVHQRGDSLPPTDFIVLGKVLVEVSLELLIANESLAAVAALELDALVQLGDGDNVESTG